MKKGKGKFIISITLLLFFLFFGSVVQTQVHEILLGKVGQPLYTLTIIGSGDGTGTVTSNLYGINCTSTVGVESGVCSAQIPMGTSIILTATPSGDHFFDGWSGGGCSGTGTCSITISGNTSVDAKFVTVIQGSNLIAWYRFNEGSGTVVYNKATDGSGGGGLLPNLAVVQNQGLFWTFLSGFGSTPQLFFGGGSGLTDFAWAAQSRTLGGASGGGWGGFARKKPDFVGGEGGYIFYMATNLTGGVFERLFTCNPEAGQGFTALYDGGSQPSFPYDAALIDVWLFHFIRNDGKYCIVKPDGTLMVSALAVNMVGTGLLTHVVSAGYPADNPVTMTYYPGGSSYGDWIIYNGAGITTAQWAQWYDKLRTRYGMAARSGW